VHVKNFAKLILQSDFRKKRKKKKMEKRERVSCGVKTGKLGSREASLKKLRARESS